MESLRLGIYRHYKTGDEYRLLFIAKGQFSNSPLDMQDMVVYETVKDNPVSKWWVRPLTEFTEQVQHNEVPVPRFTFVRE